ncbi:hypothetical protein MBLNU230_g2446t1 [Neophaeotheca triangularis]
MPIHVGQISPGTAHSPRSPKPQKPFEYPTNQHLLITTPSYIFAWDTQGFKTVFSSSKAGIVAAKEAKDGSGILAVADKHVVVLHDTNRGQEKSWGLNADGDEVRQIEYTADSRDLYLTTKLTGSVQRYSTEHARLLNSPSVHNSTPIALSISPTGHLLLSASNNPPSVYVKNLAHNATPVLLQPRASDGPVCVASFHPDRANIFLLGFANGTLAAYDATRVMKRQHGKYANQEHANRGEIARFAEMHRPTSKAGASGKSLTITGAAFLPGYKTRAISVGSDGRCRLVDFADGGITLRTWHAKAPLTSVSVMAMKEEASRPLSTKPTPYARRKRPGEGFNVIGGPTSTNNLIAVGRADGKVLIYDSLGILLKQKSASVRSERVIGVEWAKGLSPSPITPGLDGRDPSEALSASLPSLASQTTPRRPSHPTPISRRRQSTLAPGLGLPTTLRQHETSPMTVATRRLTIHPDEREDAEAEGTIRRTPSPKRTDAAAATGVVRNDFLDLFSPVKLDVSDLPPPKQQRTSPAKARPRISTNTFIKDQAQIAEPPVVFSPTFTLPALDPAMTEGYQVSTGDSPRAVSVRRVRRKESPLNTTRRRSSIKPAPYASGTNTAEKLSVLPAIASDNATILANLRQLSVNPNAQANDPPKPLFSRKQNPTTSSNPPAQPYEAQKATSSRKKDKRASGYRLRRIHWQTDSVQSSLSDIDHEDIWLTSQSEREMKPRRTRSRRGERPPARQTSRTRVEANGGTVSTMATTTGIPSRSAPPPPPAEPEDELVAPSTQSPTPLPEHKPFQPSTTQIQAYFPRTSSLSPKRRTRSPVKDAHKVLHDLDANKPLPQAQHSPTQSTPPLAKNPWLKAAVHKESQARDNTLTTQPARLTGFAQSNDPREQTSRLESGGSEDDAASVVSHCAACSRTRGKMRVLEEEVARMRGEVLALKMALRERREVGGG